MNIKIVWNARVEDEFASHEIYSVSREVLQKLLFYGIGFRRSRKCLWVASMQGGIFCVGGDCCAANTGIRFTCIFDSFLHCLEPKPLLFGIYYINTP